MRSAAAPQVIMKKEKAKAKAKPDAFSRDGGGPPVALSSALPPSKSSSVAMAAPSGMLNI